MSKLRPIHDGGATVAGFLAAARGSGQRLLDAVGEEALMVGRYRLAPGCPRVHRAWFQVSALV